jgi:hypothetical protein
MASDGLNHRNEGLSKSALGVGSRLAGASDTTSVSGGGRLEANDGSNLSALERPFGRLDVFLAEHTRQSCTNYAVSFIPRRLRRVLHNQIRQNEAVITLIVISHAYLLFASGAASLNQCNRMIEDTVKEASLSRSLLSVPKIIPRAAQTIPDQA